MSLKRTPAGPVYDAAGSGTISSSTAGVNGPNVSCEMVVFSIPSSVTTTINLCSDSTCVGGIEMQPSISYGPYPTANLNLHWFKAAAGTPTVNYAIWK